MLAAVLLAAGCGASPTGPDAAAPIRVTVEPTPTLIGGPDIATFTLRVENISQSVVDLTFPSSCQVLPSFADRSGQPVTPRGGGFACATVITSRTLRPGEGFAQVFAVKAGSAPEAQYIVLPPGEYRIEARVEDSRYRVKSAPLAFSLQ